MIRRTLLLLAAALAPAFGCGRARPAPTVDLPSLLSKLDDPDPLVRSQGVRSLGEAGARAKSATPGLVRLLRDDSAEVRFATCNSLRILKVTDEETARALVAATRDAVGKVRALAAKALRDGDPSVVVFFASSLLECLADPDSEVRRYAEETFHALGPGAEQVLARGLTHENAAIRAASARILVPEPRGAMWGLILHGLPHRNEFVRAASAHALAAMGPRAWPAKDALEQALRDPAGPVRDAAGFALDAIKDDAERREAAMSKFDQRVSIGEIFERFEGAPSAIEGSWPTFLGPGHDAVSREEVPLASSWPGAGPRLCWSIPLVDGYSGAAIHRGRVYVLDYDLQARREQLRCLSLDDGKEIWRRSHRVNLINQHGYVHAVPSVSDDFAVVIGALNHVMCVRPDTGELLWGLDLRRTFGPQFENFFSVQSPLIDGSTVVLAVGSPDALLVGLDGATGRVLWKTPNPARKALSYSSVVPATLHGRKSYLYAASGGTVAVSAEADTIGKLLWETDGWEPTVPVPAPVLLGEDRVFLTAGYGRGCLLLRAPAPGAEAAPRSLWRSDERETISSEAHTPICFQNRLFSILSESAGPLKSQLVCADPEDGGKILWSSGKLRKFGQWEPLLLADGKLYVLGKDGTLTVVRPTPERYEELGQALILEGTHDWHPWLALAGGRLVVRDSRRLVCVDLRR